MYYSPVAPFFVHPKGRRNVSPNPNPPIVTEALDRAPVVLAHRLALSDGAVAPEFARALVSALGGRDSSAGSRANEQHRVQRANAGVAVRDSMDGVSGAAAASANHPHAAAEGSGRTVRGAEEGEPRAARDEPEFRADHLAFERLWERNAPDRAVYTHAKERWERDLAEAERWWANSRRRRRA